MVQKKQTKALLVTVLGAVLLTCSGWAALEWHFWYRGGGLSAPSPCLRLDIKEALGWEKFYSQIGQDKWLIGRVFPGVTDGYFVDIGCADGVLHSNTKALEDLGWQGIGIDPFPTNWRQRKAKVFRKVVYSTSGETVRFRRAGLLGGIEQSLQAHKAKTEDSEIVEFETTTIGEILEQAGAPPFIHYISIDVEGAEYEVLKAFPFSKYQVGAFTIEHNFEEPKRRQIRNLLESHGYRLEREQMVDDWFVRAAQ